MQKIENVPREMSFVDLVLQVFINCGKKAITVNEPATEPIVDIKSIKTPVERLRLAYLRLDILNKPYTQAASFARLVNRGQILRALKETTEHREHMQDFTIPKMINKAFTFK